jgi:hypothetical protein
MGGEMNITSDTSTAKIEVTDAVKCERCGEWRLVAVVRGASESHRVVTHCDCGRRSRGQWVYPV